MSRAVIQVFVLGVILPLIAGASPETSLRMQSTTGWVAYRNTALDYSFRYPPGLRLVHLSVPDFHIEGLVEAIQLVSEPDSRIVLRVMVVEPAGNPRVAVYDFEFLRKVCKRYEEFRLADRTAVNCVTCGRASCSWTVDVPGARQFRIFSMLPDEMTKPRAEDAEFPLLSIIQTFRMGSAVDQGGS